jgi:hypothetical protein
VPVPVAVAVLVVVVFVGLAVAVVVVVPAVLAPGAVPAPGAAVRLPPEAVVVSPGVLGPPPGVAGAELGAELLGPPAQASSTGKPSRPGISLPLRTTELKNFSAVLRSLKVMSVAAAVVWMPVNSPMPW